MRRTVSIKRKRDGHYKVDLPDDVRAFLANLADQLDPALDHDLPLLRRLFPTAYPDDPELDAGYQVLARGELIDDHRAAIETLRQTSTATTLDEDQLLAWMRVINAMRLVLGTQLDVSEGEIEIDPDDPDAEVLHIYDLLGFLLDIVVQALASGMDD